MMTAAAFARILNNLWVLPAICARAVMSYGHKCRQKSRSGLMETNGDYKICVWNKYKGIARLMRARG